LQARGYGNCVLLNLLHTFVSFTLPSIFMSFTFMSFNFSSIHLVLLDHLPDDLVLDLFFFSVLYILVSTACFVAILFTAILVSIHCICVSSL